MALLKHKRAEKDFIDRANHIDLLVAFINDVVFLGSHLPRFMSLF